MTLLETARSIPAGRGSRTKVTREECELAIEYLHHRITGRQLAGAAKHSGGNGGSWASATIRRGIASGMVVVALRDQPEPRSKGA
jgi:hypothetical protein